MTIIEHTKEQIIPVLYKILDGKSKLFINRSGNKDEVSTACFEEDRLNYIVLKNGTPMIVLWSDVLEFYPAA